MNWAKFKGVMYIEPSYRTEPSLNLANWIEQFAIEGRGLRVALLERLRRLPKK